MSAKEVDPILDAKPPATDPLTYLTILEYNLSEQNLFKLHNVLQDQALTDAIGWDLIQLLLPLTPLANDCLDTVARLGNPREVILKVTEAIYSLDFEVSTAIEETATDERTKISCGRREVGQFTTLLSMLAILHRRLSTRRPSRFVATSLKSVMKALGRMVDVEAMLDVLRATATLVSELTLTLKPSLPPRSNTSPMITNSTEVDLDNIAEHGDDVVCRQLLQSFWISVHENVMSSVQSSHVPGLGLSDRLCQRLFPPKVLSHTSEATNNPLYTSALCLCDEAMNISIDVANKLPIPTTTLVHSANNPEHAPAWLDFDDASTESTATAMSGAGAVLLLGARSTLAFLLRQDNIFLDKAVFPDYSHLLFKYANHYHLFDEVETISGATATLFDSLVAMGLLHLQNCGLGRVPDDKEFFQHMQALTIISAVSASQHLRYSAFVLATATLRLHPSAQVRLTFIRDTLENCPLENLKVCAIGWFKDETLRSLGDSKIAGKDECLFSTPAALQSVSSSLFPSLSLKFADMSAMQRWKDVQQSFGLYMATLNLYYLLISNALVASALHMSQFHSVHTIDVSYLAPLRQMTIDMQRLHSSSADDIVETGDDSHSDASPMQLMLLENALARIDENGAKLI